jgi:MFS family permease
MATAAKQAKGLLFLALFTSIVGFSILFPILAPLSRSLGLSEVEVGWLSTSYSLMQFIGSPYFGKLSERIGRKPVLLLGVFGFALGFGSFGVIAYLGQLGRLPHTALFALLVSARMMGGFLSSATLPAAQAYIADVTERHERASGMALVGAAFGLGLIFGPLIGALLSRFGLLTPIWVSMCVALVNGLFIATSLPVMDHRVIEETPHHEGMVRRTWPILAVAFVTVLASVAMEQTIAFLYQDTLRLSARSTAHTVGIALGAYGLSAVMAQGFVVRRLNWTPQTLMRAGVSIGLLGFGGLIVSHSFGFLTASMAIQGFGYGLTLPGLSALLSVSVGDGEQGEVAGLNSSTQALGRTVGPLIGTSLYRVNPRYPYSLSLLMLVGVLLVITLGSGWRKSSFGTSNLG